MSRAAAGSALLPDGSRPYKRTPVFTESTVPAALRADHSTKAGVWGLLQVNAGSLTYVVAETGEEAVLDAGASAVIRPQERHRVVIDGPVEFFVEFHRVGDG
jgi:tellurite resistance-related uncharacterized protein